MSALPDNDALHPSKVKRLPGDSDVWIFIIAELVMFGAFFLAYIINREGNATLYNASQQALDRRVGGLNALLLISSSWAVVSAVGAARQSRRTSVSRYLSVAILLGAAFVILKCIEYSAKFKLGITMMTNAFYMFYFSLTMIHLLHVIAGMVMLIVMRNNARTGVYCAGNTKGLETGASYWHMVDLLYIFLFSLLYLLR